MAFCSNCGFQLNGVDKFCPNCGIAVETKQTPENPTPVQPELTVPVYTAPSAPVQPEPTAPVYTAPSTAVYPIPTEPVYTAPTAQAYQQPAVAVTAEPEVSGKTKALGFVGMGVSIEGLMLAVIGLLYTMIFMSIDAGMGFGWAIGCGIFSLPSGIVGRMLCNKSLAGGFRSGACTAGAKMGVAAIVISAVMLFLGFVCLVTG